ncbi:hypothetical protein AA313_de0204096 [Arthrobotrys entomopaga]|nr:hypothetical protein AA313_de0204096 [Arthrobotrys entomopaga]
MSNSTEPNTIPAPERSWPAGELQEYAPNNQFGSTSTADILPGEPPIYYGHASKEAYEEHERRLYEGLPPPIFRFHPIETAKITFRSTSKLSSYANFLWPAVFIGIILWYTVREKHPRLVFAFNFVGIIPAGNLLAFASGELQHKLPPVSSPGH